MKNFEQPMWDVFEGLHIQGSEGLGKVGDHSKALNEILRKYFKEYGVIETVVANMVKWKRTRRAYAK